MEANRAFRRSRYMWAKLGRLFEQTAYARAENGSSLDRLPALDFAKTAEACFWQSTGDADAIDLKDV
jgi:hypothetical protein